MSGEKLVITEVCYFWESFLGVAKLQHFAVRTDSGVVYNLVHNTTQQSWSAEMLDNIVGTKGHR